MDLSYSSMLMYWEIWNTSHVPAHCADPRSAKFRLPFYSASVSMPILPTVSVCLSFSFCYPSPLLGCQAAMGSVLMCSFLLSIPNPECLGLSKSVFLQYSILSKILRGASVYFPQSPTSLNSYFLDVSILFPQRS
jgi:hypothetical protein